jgi:hypothetical protein
MTTEDEKSKFTVEILKESYNETFLDIQLVDTAFLDTENFPFSRGNGIY